MRTNGNFFRPCHQTNPSQDKNLGNIDQSILFSKIWETQHISDQDIYKREGKIERIMYSLTSERVEKI